MAKVTYIAEPILEIDGQQAPKNLIEDILQISVEESLHLPGMFTLVVRNDYFPGRTEDQIWKYESLFTIGKSIKIGFSASTTQAQEFEQETRDYILDGEITAMETHFTSTSQAPVVIRGYDVSHRLHRGRYNRSFQNMTDSDIVKKIAGEVGIPLGTVSASSGPYGYGDINGANGYVFQQNQTNMEFLRERAARIGFELFIQNGQLNFRKPASGESLNLKWLEDIHSFQVRVTSAEQVSGVEVRAWNYKLKQPIISEKNKHEVMTTTNQGNGSSTSTAFHGKPPTPKMIVVDQPVYSNTEADQIAQSLCNELGGEFVHADAKGEGNPQIRPGKVVQLSNMGKYSGNYYVTETIHLYHERVYSTDFSVRGLREGDLLATLSPQTHLKPGQTLLVGIVTDNNDPHGWGRVRVKFPTLTEEHASYWARVLGTGAGNLRGFDCLPEINDEVLVAFEHGDIHRPYIIGGVWNGTDAPPERVTNSVMNGKVRLRTFKTRTGHVLQFIEEDKGASKKGVYVDTVYGHQVQLNDSDRFVLVKTKQGHYVRLDDQQGKIEIKTSRGGKATITMTSSTGEINIKAGTKLTLDAAQIDITATGIVDVKGKLIKLN